MARPIEPVAVRRNADTVLEVQSKGGVWFPWSIVSDAVKRNVRNAVGGRPFPPYEFLWNLSDMPPEQAPTPYVPTEQAPQDDAPVETDAPRDDAPQQQQQQQQDAPQPQPQPQPQRERSPLQLTIEDIVREIAGEMDTNTVSAVIDTVGVMINDALAQHVPTAPTTPLTPVLTNVTIHRPDLAPLPVDGLFHKNFPMLLRAMSVGQHIYLPGTPGTGKSHAAAQSAEALGMKFGSTSFGPTTPESRLVGGMTANGEFFEPAFLEGIRHAMDNPDSGYVHCFDEMDNAHPGILATMNSILANGWMTAPNGDHLTVGSNFVIVACANTYGTGPTAEFAGRNKLDPATLDRFAYIPWDIDTGMEEMLVRQRIADDQVATAWLDVWRTTRQNVASHGLKLFITPRGAVNGAKLIAGGFDIQDAYMMVLGNKVPADQFAKINAI